MSPEKYQDIAEYVQAELNAKDCLHTYRVLNYALQLIGTEDNVNVEVVILSALLHDIGRIKKSAKDSKNVPSHAQTGSEKAYELLIEKGYPEEIAKQVSESVLSHSKNSKPKPQTIEAKILFDADKLDMTGAIGTARAIQLAGATGVPLYLTDKAGFPIKEGKKKEAPSLFKDYQQELKKMTKVFHTAKAQKIAIKHQKTMDSYFEKLHKEVDKNHKNGMKLLHKYCKEA
ncbi:MAG: HD domain-containing protein [Desulfuromonadales bacterium]|nr:HD domain-containing protein [Desulfuromonadales bacterium]